MLRLIRYQDTMKESWNNFLGTAINGHFFFHRDYFLHQKERFEDHSVIVFKDAAIAGVFAAVEITDESGVKEWCTHLGLSFGGLIQSSSIGMNTVAEIFRELKWYLLKNGFSNVKYKAMPHIYYSTVSFEDRYALFINGAKQWYTQPYSVIPQDTYRGLSSRQKTRIRSVLKNSAVHFSDIQTEQELREFYHGLCANLEKKYGVQPVHSLDELKQLKMLFPDNVLIKALRQDTKILAGVVLFVSNHVTHAQYLYNTPQGQKVDGLMILLDKIIGEYNKNYFFSLGTSSEEEGRVLNSGLIQFKEKFGARTLTQDFYIWRLKEGCN